MKVLMLQTRKGSPNGFKVIQYEESIEYDIQESLAREFIANGWAKKIIEVKDKDV